MTDKEDTRPTRIGWGDPIGAAYAEWKTLTDETRVNAMAELAIELSVRGFDMSDVLIEFAKVQEFFALGRQSFMMCRALTTALLGQTLEPNTMSFDELFQAYGTDMSQRIKQHNLRVEAAL